MQAQPDSRDEITWFQCAILALSIYVLIALAAQTFLRLPARIDALLDLLDTGICFVFIGDFFYRLYRAPSKRGFLQWGWIDLVSSIPLLPYVRWGRAARVIRIVRTLRAFRSTRILVRFLFQHRARSTFAAVSLISVLLVIFSSIAVLNFETVPECNIKTPADAIWWSSVTLSTVGNSGLSPITLEGRLVGIVLMIAGMGLFGTLTGFIASFFLGADHEEEEADLQTLIGEVRLLREQIERNEKARDRLDKR